MNLIFQKNVLSELKPIKVFGSICFRNKSEAALERCSYKKVFWRYASNLQKNTHAEVWFQSNFIEMTLRHRCSPVNLLHIFGTPFPKNTSGGLLQENFIKSEFLEKRKTLVFCISTEVITWMCSVKKPEAAMKGLSLFLNKLAGLTP